MALAPLEQKFVPFNAVSVNACLLKNLTNLSAQAIMHVKHLAANSAAESPLCLAFS
jgi:hypothetical protein